MVRKVKFIIIKLNAWENVDQQQENITQYCEIIKFMLRNCKFNMRERCFIIIK